MDMPKDPVMLLSFINTRLRDFYPGLDELCGAMSVEREFLERRLEEIDYHYDPQKNQFL